MSDLEFAHLLDTIDTLSNEQMRHLFHELEARLAEAEKPPAVHTHGSLGAMRDAARELDEAVEHAMSMRERSWRTPSGE
jgi:hypothetical protein